MDRQKTGAIDSLYVINPVFSIYIGWLVGLFLFHFFCFVKSFFPFNDVIGCRL